MLFLPLTCVFGIQCDTRECGWPTEGKLEKGSSGAVSSQSLQAGFMILHMKYFGVYSGIQEAQMLYKVSLTDVSVCLW